jgi:hypothetical protein
VSRNELICGLLSGIQGSAFKVWSSSDTPNNFIVFHATLLASHDRPYFFATTCSATNALNAVNPMVFPERGINTPGNVVYTTVYVSARPGSTRCAVCIRSPSYSSPFSGHTNVGLKSDPSRPVLRATVFVTVSARQVSKCWNVGSKSVPEDGVEYISRVRCNSAEKNGPRAAMSFVWRSSVHVASSCADEPGIAAAKTLSKRKEDISPMVSLKTLRLSCLSNRSPSRLHSSPQHLV